MASNTTTQDITGEKEVATSPKSTYDTGDNTNEILAAVLVTAGCVLICVLIYVVHKKCCRSPTRKHGVERQEVMETPKGKRMEYYDQFGCDTNELTVNSVTALKWDEDENPPWLKNKLTHSKSSGIECDTTSVESKDVQRITSGKRVFQVNKVTEAKPKPRSPGQPQVIRLPKGLANAARSLQASDNQHLTLAIIDKNSKTIHNIDLRNYRPRTRGKSPLAGDGEAQPRPTAHRGQRRRLHSTGDTAYQTGPRSDIEMVHDSPDLGRRPRRGTQSAEQLIQPENLSAEEGSSDSTRPASSSVSSSDDADARISLLTPPIHGNGNGVP